MHASTEVALVLVARLCLAYFFLPSAYGKLANLPNFVQGTLDYQVLPQSAARVFGTLLPWLELSLASALILGIGLPIAAIMTSILLLCFITAVVINLRRGRVIPCNCYGIADTNTISRGTIMRNVMLLIFAAIIVIFAPLESSYLGWLALWRTDLSLFASKTSSVLIVFLLVFFVVSVQLVEWTVDIFDRVSQIKVRSS